MNTLLQLTDAITGRRCIVRIDSEEAALPLASLLDRYLKHCPARLLLEEGRVTVESSETLLSFQDLVYACSDTGELQDIYPGVELVQQGKPLVLDRPPAAQPGRVGGVDVTVLDIGIDRTDAGYDRNWTGFHRRRWERHADLYERFVLDALLASHTETESEEILALESTTAGMALVEALARRVWESDFESYSRFVERRLPYKTGDETVRGIVAGDGGVCSEKVQALKFLTDHYCIESEVLIAGADVRGPVPERRLREMLDAFDFRFAKRHMRYWQHNALLYTIDGSTLLVDATNGNIPLLCLKDEESRRLMVEENKEPVVVRMALQTESLYYHRVSQDIPEDLFFAMEAWAPDIDLIQVFDNELGLMISPGYFVTPIVFKNEAAYERLSGEYLRAAQSAGLEYDVSREWTLETRLGQRFAGESPRAAGKIMAAREHLLARYNLWEAAEHDAGLVVIALGRSTPVETCSKLSQSCSTS